MHLTFLLPNHQCKEPDESRIGKADGVKNASMENARNFFANGISFEIVRNSIQALSDEVLQEIYDEVMANKKETAYAMHALYA